ncbi:Uncharacterised protein [Vibrio cholerae]|nr:Uncharacterised protein [Vibrio cholerae]
MSKQQSGKVTKHRPAQYIIKPDQKTKSLQHENGEIGQ